MKTFKILRGGHRIGGKYDERGRCITPGQNLKKGATFECSRDLHKEDPQKFALVSTEEIQEEEEQQEDEALSLMTKDELIAFAEEEGIDINPRAKLETILKAVQEATQGE